MVFLVIHLAGNLLLYSPHPEHINEYTQSLRDKGWLLTLAEIGLLLAFVVHIALATVTALRNRSARGVQGYAVTKTKGGPSKNTLGSRNMIITGAVTLAFLIVHLKNFRFGPGPAAGYVTSAQGRDIWDVHQLIVDDFHRGGLVAFYVACIFFLGFHLRHGFWSAFQSLGAMNPRWSRPVYALALIIAVLLALGFLCIPLWIYFDIPSRFL